MAKTVSIHSYRGGTGKSNTTANLATAVARRGYRVGIIDTDIPSPGIHVLFGFDETNIQYSLNDYLWERCTIKEAAYDVSWVLNNLGAERSRVYLVPSSVKMGDIAQILQQGYDVGMLREGFQNLIDDLELDYLFIDTHPGLNEETLLSIAFSDVLVLVLRPDRQDYQGTAITIDVARKLDVPKLLLVVNKAPSVLKFDQLQKQVESAYNATVAGIIPHSDEVMLLASSGIFTMQNPEHELTKIVEEITQKILE